jgi:hypothetical protein
MGRLNMMSATSGFCMCFLKVKVGPGNGDVDRFYKKQTLLFLKPHLFLMVIQLIWWFLKWEGRFSRDLC